MNGFVEVNSAELDGPALDWAVAIADEEEHPQVYGGVVYVNGTKMDAFAVEYRPSTNWSQGGPLLDIYDIALNGGQPCGERAIYATLRAVDDEVALPTATGPTRLIAASRVIVVAKLGDMVMVPNELYGCAR